MLFFLLGAYASLMQIALLRECFLLFSGNELCWALQLGIWLLFTGAGGALRAAPWIQIALPFSGIWAVLAVRLIPVFSGTPVGVELPLGWALFSLAAAMAPLNLILGALFPLLSKEDPAQAGRFYRLECLGAAAAGLAYTFIFAGRVSGVTLAFGASALLSIATGGRLRFALALSLGACLLLSPGRRLDDLWWSKRLPSSLRLATVESPYQRLDLGLDQGQRTLYSNGVPMFSLEDPETPRLADLFLSLHPAPRRVAVLSEGEPGLLSRLKGSVRVVNDKAVLDMLQPGEAVTGCGRSWLERTRETFDLIVFDLPPPLSAAGNRFFTTEAFSLVKRRLAPGGVFVFRLPSSSETISDETGMMLASVHGALKKVFGRTATLAGDSMVFIAGEVPELSLKGLALRAEGDPQEFMAFHEPLFDEMRRRQQLETLDSFDVPPNADSRPMAYHLGLKRWIKEMGMGLKGLAAGLFAVLLALACWKLRKDVVVGSAVLASGFAGMAGELALVFMVQSRFGDAYKTIGSLFAAYMLGLSLGSLIKARSLPLLRACMLLSCGLAASLSWAGAEWMFGVGLFVYALALGAEFPKALAVCGGTSAGPLYALDNIGAAAAAFLCGTLLIPLLGPLRLLALLACLHAVVFMVLKAPLSVKRGF